MEAYRGLPHQSAVALRLPAQELAGPILGQAHGPRSSRSPEIVAGRPARLAVARGLDIGEGRHDPAQGVRIAPATVEIVRGHILDRDRARDVRLMVRGRPSPVRPHPGPARGTPLGRQAGRSPRHPRQPRGQGRPCRGWGGSREHRDREHPARFVAAGPVPHMPRGSRVIRTIAAILWGRPPCRSVMEHLRHIGGLRAIQIVRSARDVLWLNAIDIHFYLF